MGGSVMGRGSSTALALALSLAMVVTFAITAMAQEDVPRMTKEELKAMLDSPDLVVVDVRMGKDWKASELKIKGAVREDTAEFESWAEKYPKDKTLVLYCA
jgi:predicted sulfurtransferase